MSVKIGSARIDENGKARGGKAGDQTGKELSTQSWYKHSKGWRVFRAKSAEVAEKIAQDMQWACDNKHIGYDQGQRLTSGAPSFWWRMAMMSAKQRITRTVSATVSPFDTEDEAASEKPST